MTIIAFLISFLLLWISGYIVGRNINYNYWRRCYDDLMQYHNCHEYSRGSSASPSQSSSPSSSPSPSQELEDE